MIYYITRKALLDCILIYCHEPVLCLWLRTESVSERTRDIMYEVMETLTPVNTAPTTAVLICSPFTGTITFAPFILTEVVKNVLKVLAATDFFLVSNDVHHGDKPYEHQLMYRFVKPVTAVPWISILSRTLLDTWSLIQNSCSLRSYPPLACCFWSFIYEGLLWSNVLDYIFITLSVSSFIPCGFHEHCISSMINVT